MKTLAEIRRIGTRDELAEAMRYYVNEYDKGASLAEAAATVYELTLKANELGVTKAELYAMEHGDKKPTND